MPLREKVVAVWRMHEINLQLWFTSTAKAGSSPGHSTFPKKLVKSENFS